MTLPEAEELILRTNLNVSKISCYPLNHEHRNLTTTRNNTLD